jgi:hypothetical protein
VLSKGGVLAAWDRSQKRLLDGVQKKFTAVNKVRRSLGSVGAEGLPGEP